MSNTPDKIKAKPKTDMERRKKSDDKKRALGFIPRAVWATVEEHAKLNEFLTKLRSNEPSVENHSH